MTTGPSLPPELEDWVSTAVRFTGLSIRERSEVARELRAHLEDGIAAGRSVDELLSRFGDPIEAAARIRTARVESRAARKNALTRMMMMSWTEIGREMKRALRTLIREPGFSLVVILTLALGVGANTAVFTVLDAVLLEPLPYAAPDRLVRLYDVYLEEPDELNDYLRGPALAEWMEWDDVFDGVAALYTYRELGADLTGGSSTERVVSSRVSAGYFETLGVAPEVGRTFLREESFLGGENDGNYDGAPVTILGHRLWQRLFEGDPAVVGRTVELNGLTHEVVGVMPEGFADPLGSRADLWIPADLTFGGGNNWGNHYLTGIARLKPGLTLEAARERLNVLDARLAEANPENQGWGMAIRPLQQDLVGSSRTSLLWILASAVGLLLLSACVNVANLVFARSLARDRDVALRGALGSGRGRLVMYLLSESLVLAFVGAMAGLALGSFGIRGLLALAPDALPMIARPELSLRVFLFGMGSAVAALLLFGLAPALRMARTPPADVLRSGGRSGTEGRGLRRLRGGLVITQVAVAVVLVAGAGLLLRSFMALQSVDLVIDDRHVMTYEVHLPDARYPDGESRQQLHAQFQAAAAAIPGVEAIGATSWLPVNGRYHSWSVANVTGWDGESEFGSPNWQGTDVRTINGDYFATLGLNLVRGAEWNEPTADDPLVIWVNQALAENAEFGWEDPIGQVLYVGGEPRRIVGVVENAPHDPRGNISPKTYIPHTQFAGNRNWGLTQTLRMRPGTDVLGLNEQLRAELARLDPQLVLYRARPLSSLLATSRAQERFAALLMTVFAGLALTLACVGAYGVLAGNVARRRREIGIRMALGADPSSVRGMVMASALRLSVAGVVVGLGAAWVGSRWMAALLFQVDAGDPLVYLGGGATLLALGALAGWLPAHRATRVDPADSLVAE